MTCNNQIISVISTIFVTNKIISKLNNKGTHKYGIRMTKNNNRCGR